MGDLKYRIISKDYVVIDKSGVNLGLTLKQLRELQKLIPEMMIEMLTTYHVELLDDSQTRYHELLYAVQHKHPDETRHETALRYIQQAETPNGLTKEQGSKGNE